MTWNILTDLDTGQYMTATHMDQIRENIEHLGSLLAGITALKDYLAGAQIATVGLGSYTGDGAATKSITGLGFQPRVVITLPRINAGIRAIVIKTSQDTTYAFTSSGYWEQDHIISLNSDGFTVGDSTGTASGGVLCNNSGTVYTYMAWG